METIPTSFTTYRVEIQEVSTELTPFSDKNRFTSGCFFATLAILLTTIILGCNVLAAKGF